MSDLSTFLSDLINVVLLCQIVICDEHRVNEIYGIHGGYSSADVNKSIHVAEQHCHTVKELKAEIVAAMITYRSETDTLQDSW